MQSVFVPNLLAGQAAFVTGGGSGIGAGIAKMLARQGARVALLGRRKEKIDEVAAEIVAAGGEARTWAGDVHEYATVDAAIGEAAGAFGRLDFLVNSAAGNFLSPAASLSANGFRAVIDIDLCGTFNASRAAFAHLAKSVSRLMRGDADAMVRQRVPLARFGPVDEILRSGALSLVASGRVRDGHLASGRRRDVALRSRTVPRADGRGRRPMRVLAALWLACAAFALACPVAGGCVLGRRASAESSCGAATFKAASRTSSRTPVTPRASSASRSTSPRRSLASSGYGGRALTRCNGRISYRRSSEETSTSRSTAWKTRPSDARACRSRGPTSSTTRSSRSVAGRPIERWTISAESGSRR